MLKIPTDYPFWLVESVPFGMFGLLMAILRIADKWHWNGECLRSGQASQKEST